MGKKLGLLTCALAILASGPAVSDYSEHELAVSLIEEMVENEGFSRDELQKLFSEVERKQSILDAISRPAERTLNWGEYRKIFLKEQRIQNGVKFWTDNEEALQRVESEFGVPAQIVVSIIGVETLYGANTGSYRVMDALSTLAFDYPRRARFFRSELKHFLTLAREQNQDPLSLKGSYAGAMGLGQFMPSSYRNYAVDYDQDGFTDIWTNSSDAIWSVGNYLHKHGWQRGELITVPGRIAGEHQADLINSALKPELSLEQLAAAGIHSKTEGIGGNQLATAMQLETDAGPEYWIGLQNFYVITRYNHSKLYAMAVYQLAEEIHKNHIWEKARVF